MKIRVRVTSVYISLRIAAKHGFALLVIITAGLAGAFAQDALVTPFPAEELAGVVDDKPLATEAENAAEFRAFNRFVRVARASSVEALAEAVAPGVTVRQLYEAERQQFRGKVVRVTGQLKRLKKVPANAELRKDGIVELYEGWVEDAFTFAKPTRVMFTDAPQGIAPADEIKDVYAILEGFSFKRVQDPDHGPIPLVIGRALKRQDTTGDSAARVLTDPRCDCPKEWLEHIEDDIRPQNAKENLDESLAYDYFVLRARQVPVDLMAKHARRELTFGLLFDKGRGKYRGEIVHVEGRLKRLTWIDTTPSLEREGIKDLYEAWIFRPEYLSNPTCVILSELPPNLQPADDIPGKWASFDGYFFKRYKYKAADGTRLAPLAIGRTLTVRDPPSDADRASAVEAYAKYLLPVGVILVVVMALAIFSIGRWFHRGDRSVRDRVRNRTMIEFVEPQEPEQPEVRSQESEFRKTDPPDF